MKYRRLGKTDFRISEISLGAWQIGGTWGSGFDAANAEAVAEAAIDQGVNFIDTADIYEDGQSEAAVARVAKRRSEQVYVATKCGKSIEPHDNEHYTPEALRASVEKSLKNTGLETLDLIQLHCPPTPVYYRPEIFGLFDDLKQEGKIQNLGVSVERVEEGLKAIEFDNVTTVQIIFNMFRQRPAELFFREASARDVGLIIRVPLASGLLTGKFDKQTRFGEDDHRNYNREGESFDKGETFAGIPYETGLEAVQAVQAHLPKGDAVASAALRWILKFEEVSTIIPGASRVEQAVENASAADQPPLSDDLFRHIQEIYSSQIKPHVHQLW